MKTLIPPIILLSLMALACQDAGPTEPLEDLGPAAFAEKPDKPPGQDKETAFEFDFPRALGDFGSDCWYPEAGTELNLNGRDFRCTILGDPTLVVRVLDGNGDPVSSGWVTFKRCEDFLDPENPVPVRWDLCGVRQKGQNNKRFQSVVYSRDEDLSDGLASMTLTERTVFYDLEHYPNQPEELGWGGFHWNYSSDGEKNDLKGDSYNFRPYPAGSTS
jgi:hypothetical protein